MSYALILLSAKSSTQPSTIPTLKNAFKGHFYVGVAINTSIATGKAIPYFNRPQALVDKDIALVKQQFNAISPENDLKWDATQPRPGANGYNFGPADAYVAFGLKNHMLIVGHTLVWHSQTPNWVFAGPDKVAGATASGTDITPNHVNEPAAAPTGFGRFFGFSGPYATRDQLLKRMREHIDTVVGRYKGKIKIWDVVNECVSDGGPNVLRNSLWRQIIGPDFVAKAFEYAHEADPKAILRLNDYSLENPEKRHKFMILVKHLLAEKVPIMAIGTQTHVSVSYPSYAQEDQALTDLETLGLPIDITELDVNGAVAGQNNTGANVANNSNTTKGGLVDNADQLLANQYTNLFKLFMKHKLVKLVTFWDVNDAVSWRSAGKPLLFDGNDQPKPAFYAVIRVAEDSKDTK